MSGADSEDPEPQREQQQQDDDAGDEEQEPRQPALLRLAAMGRSGAAAAGNATLAALSATRDGIESFRYGAKKTADKMDKWAAAGIVSIVALLMSEAEVAPLDREAWRGAALAPFPTCSTQPC